MKTLISVPLVVLIAVVFIPFQTYAQLNAHSIDEYNNKLHNLHTDIGDMMGKQPWDNDRLDNFSYMDNILTYIELELDHLSTLLCIRDDVVTSASERSKITGFIKLQIQQTIKWCSIDIDHINRRMGTTNNQVVILNYDHVKLELRNLQKMLQDSSTL